MTGLWRFSTLLIFLSFSIFSILVSCSTSESVAVEAAVPEEPKATMSVDTSEKEINTEPGQSVRFSGLPEDSLEKVAALWADGRAEQARRWFWSDDVRALKNGLRSDEWSMWRGRLYIQGWNGPELGLAGDNVSAVLADGDDIWLGTWTGGLSRYSTPVQQNINWDPGMPSLAVRTVNRILRDGEILRVVRYGGMETYDFRSSRWHTEHNLPVSERLQDYFVADDRHYLASLGQGLWMEGDYGWTQLLQPGLFINRIEKGTGREILVATMDRGVYIYNPQTGHWQRPENRQLRNANVTSVILHESLLIGGTYGGGAFFWDRETGEVGFFDEGILGDAWVLAVADQGDWVYFATFGAGLNAWNTDTGAWDRLGISEGLPVGDIASLDVADDGSLWAGTLGGGIVRFQKGIHGE